MADGADVAVKLKEQGKLLSLRDIGAFHQHTVLVEDFLEDLGAEPLRDQRHLQIAGIAVVGVGTEIHDAIRIERRGITLGVQRNADSAGDGLRRSIGKGAVIALGELGGMNILQVVFDFITHV